MKTPCYPTWNESEVHLSETELRERKLVQRLSSREDVREILLVMTPALKLFQTTGGDWLVKHLSALFHSNLSQISHWAIRIGDNFFELQRADYDHAQTELRVSKWTQERQKLISHSFPQGVTALNDPEIEAIGQRHFSKLNRMHINKYDVWKNNCHVAVDSMLHEIGGLSRHRENLKSMEEWTRQFFCESMMIITRLWYRLRGCNEEVIEKYETSMRHTLEVLTPISRHYPKRQWIREDMARTSSSKISVVGGHWYLSVLESALSLRKHTEYSYFKVGADGKPELKFELVQEAVKGIWNGDDASKNLAWLKALPWLAAGFVVGTPRWAFAVIYLVCESGKVKLNERLGRVAVENRTSPSLKDTEHSSYGRKRRGRTSRRRKSKAKSSERDNDRELVERYERRTTSSGVPFFVDRMSNTETWDAPGSQELCLRIKDIPLPKRWQEHQEDDGPLFYVHSITGEIRDSKSGPSELWIVKKKVETGWVKSSIMPLPAGWELCRSDTGEKYYLDHNNNPPTCTSVHPIAQEIADERKILLPEWNVEWDEERGKKYRNMETQEIRWKKVDGPLYDPEIARPKIDGSQSRRVFVEPLPAGWMSTVDDDGKIVYVNEGERRTSHPYNDKRRRLLPQWEMRYTASSRRYWVHYGQGGRGSTWWTRNKLVKNTSLNNNACGWKQGRNGEWEWFEGGDAPHSGIPMLDLEDPADFEFREYPFISPRELQTSDAHFLEPLPHDWILRPIKGGVKYYYNFRTKTPSSEHPYEKERQDLPALWEMRWTQHGKQYYINHGTGLTWWTNPRMDKHKQKPRADANQKQDGWKWDEDEGCWVRFSEIPSQESVGKVSPNQANQADSDIGSTDGDLEKETRRILAQTREWLKEVNAEELLSEIQSQLRERGSQKLSSTTQWLKDRGGKIGEDEKVKKMRHWMKERSASETLGNLKKEVKARRGYLNSLSMHCVSRDTESAKDPEDLESGPDGTDGAMLQNSDLPTPAHHENEHTASDYFQLGSSTMQSASKTPALDTGGVPKTSEYVKGFYEDANGAQTASEKEDLELLPSDSLETPSTKKREEFLIIGQHIKENRNILPRHGSEVLTQRKAEMEERWRSTIEKKRLASERKSTKDGKLRGEEVLPADQGVELPDDEHGAQNSVVKAVGQETAEVTPVDPKVPEGQNLSSVTQMDSAEETGTGKRDNQSSTSIDLSTSSTIAADVGSITEGEILSKDTVGADKEPPPNNKSFLGTVNALLGADRVMESVTVKAESGRKKWLKKAWAKV